MTRTTDDKSDVDLIFGMSDFHFGSSSGLCPPVCATLEGSTYNHNKIQGFLWEAFEDFTGLRWKKTKRWKDQPQPGEIAITKNGWIHKVAKGREFGLLLNGDLTEGDHHGTKELIHPDVAAQSPLAKHVLCPLAEQSSATFVVMGTDCHVKQMESGIGQELGARYCKDSKSWAWPQLQMRFNGTLVFVKHHISASSRPWLMSMQLAAALAAEQLNAVKMGHEPPRVVIRSHRHEHGEFRGPQGLMVVLPPWQGLTSHGRKVVQQSLPVPGGVSFDFSDMDENGLPRTRVRLYYPEADEVVEMSS